MWQTRVLIENSSWRILFTLFARIYSRGLLFILQISKVVCNDVSNLNDRANTILFELSKYRWFKFQLPLVFRIYFAFVWFNQEWKSFRYIFIPQIITCKTSKSSFFFEHGHDLKFSLWIEKWTFRIYCLCFDSINDSKHWDVFSIVSIPYLNCRLQKRILNYHLRRKGRYCVRVL